MHHKRLYWWEKSLASIIASNFRVEMYYERKDINNRKQSTTAIKFFGYKDDVDLAVDVYNLAYDAISLYTKRFVNDFYKGRPRTHSVTNEVKNSYIQGFLAGLRNKFKEQVSVLRKEYEVMVMTPKEVKEQFEVMTSEWKETTYSRPDIQNDIAYCNGYNDGKRIDYTQSTIDEKILAAN